MHVATIACSPSGVATKVRIGVTCDWAALPCLQASDRLFVFQRIVVDCMRRDMARELRQAMEYPEEGGKAPDRYARATSVASQSHVEYLR